MCDSISNSGLNHLAVFMIIITLVTIIILWRLVLWGWKTNARHTMGEMGFEYVVCCTSAVTSGSGSSPVHLWYQNTNPNQVSATPFTCSGWRLRGVCNCYETKCYFFFVIIGLCILLRVCHLFTGSAWNVIATLFSLADTLMSYSVFTSWYTDREAEFCLGTGSHSPSTIVKADDLLPCSENCLLNTILSQMLPHDILLPVSTIYNLVFCLIVIINPNVFPFAIFHPKYLCNFSSSW
jgi:hypothetical protein